MIDFCIEYLKHILNACTSNKANADKKKFLRSSFHASPTSIINYIPLDFIDSLSIHSRWIFYFKYHFNASNYTMCL